VRQACPLQKILRRLFSSEGYEVDVVPGGVAGVEMLRQRPPSVEVLDLPYAESSGDLCRKIANLISGLPLVIIRTQCAGGSFTTIPDSLTVVANYACEESQTPCTLANRRAQDLFPIGPEIFLNAQTALIAKHKAPALFSHGAWNKSPLSQFS
jgi:CheY-like chemotaxis protein